MMPEFYPVDEYDPLIDALGRPAKQKRRVTDLERDVAIRLAGILDNSVTDGPGVRLVEGCPHGCPGCHNPDTHARDGGVYETVTNILERAVRNPLLAGITLSGGEPFEQPDAFAVLAEAAASYGLNIVTYTALRWRHS